jgi:hypothetical protein
LKLKESFPTPSFVKRSEVLSNDLIRKRESVLETLLASSATPITSQESKKVSVAPTPVKASSKSEEKSESKKKKKTQPKAKSPAKEKKTKVKSPSKKEKSKKEKPPKKKSKPPQQQQQQKPKKQVPPEEEISTANAYAVQLSEEEQNLSFRQQQLPLLPLPVSQFPLLALLNPLDNQASLASYVSMSRVDQQRQINILPSPEDSEPNSPPLALDFEQNQANSQENPIGSLASAEVNASRMMLSPSPPLNLTFNHDQPQSSLAQQPNHVPLVSGQGSADSSLLSGPQTGHGKVLYGPVPVPPRAVTPSSLSTINSPDRQFALTPDPSEGVKPP